jgi:hypothetical protein
MFTTIARYATGEMARIEQKDILQRIFKHAHNWMYKSLQLYVPGNVKDRIDLH